MPEVSSDGEVLSSEVPSLADSSFDNDDDDDTGTGDGGGDLDEEYVGSPSSEGVSTPSLLRELDSDLTPTSTQPAASKRVSRAPRSPSPSALRKPSRTSPRVSTRVSIDESKNTSISPPRRGRGRPRKKILPDPMKLVSAPAPAKRGRGRPPGTGWRQLAAKRDAQRTEHVPAATPVYHVSSSYPLADEDPVVSDLVSLHDRQVVGASHPCFAVVCDADSSPVDRSSSSGDANGSPVDRPSHNYSSSLLTAPLNYRQAHKRPDSAEWSIAEEREMTGLASKKVFAWVKLTDLPPGIKPLTTRFVYDFKTNEMNEIVKYKARLVVRGFEQREGIDYGETHSATIRATSVRTILSLAARNRLRLWQMDVEQAFLTAKMGREVVYCRPPPGQERPGYVWLLQKALYGLKQASNLFERHFSAILTGKLGLHRLHGDRSIYFKKVKRGSRYELLIVGVYVDDLIVAYGSDEMLNSFKRDLQEYIGMKDVGPLRYCLGIHITQDPESFSVHMDQRGFVTDLLTRTGHMGVNEATRVTPTIAGLRLSLQDCPTTPADIHEMSVAPYNTYRSIVGSLMYLAGATRPDVCFAVNLLSRYVANPGKAHWRALIHLLRYLRGTMDLGVDFCGHSSQGIILEDERVKQWRHSSDDLPNPRLVSESFHNNLVAYCDADWATDPDKRRSCTGWVIFLNGGPIAWRTRRQSIVATSTAESELYSLGDCMRELQWLRSLLQELGFPQPQTTPGRGGAVATASELKNSGTVIFEDNQACLQISQNEVFHQRTKHIDIQWCFVMQAVERGEFSVQPTGTDDQIADLLTKGVTRGVQDALRSKLMGSWHHEALRRARRTTVPPS